jgi:hypothetical protein
LGFEVLDLGLGVEGGKLTRLKGCADLSFDTELVLRFVFNEDDMRVVRLQDPQRVPKLLLEYSRLVKPLLLRLGFRV